MKIQTLRLRKFKKFSRTSFQFHPQFTVLIGDNATGKTSILDALSIMLSTYVLRFDMWSGRPGFKTDEIQQKIFERDDVISIERQKGAHIVAEGFLNDKFVLWTRKPNDRTGSAKTITEIAEFHALAVSEGEDIDLPVLIYYGTSRLWDAHKKISVKNVDSRTIGYKNCLDSGSDQNLFVQWFKHLELASLQKKKNLGVLESVRKVVCQCIPGATNFYFDVANDALMVEFNNEEYRLFNTMSDGFRNMVAMVADIAHRAARLNPHLGVKAASGARGVVLIDEIDLHLHPKWQRRVVDDLKTAFPHIQFIVTTHSPFIVQSLDSGELLDLTALDSGRLEAIEYSGIAWPGPGNEYSHRSTEDILEDVMGVAIPQRSERHKAMFESAKKYYEILQKGAEADEAEKEKLKQELDKLSAPFSDNIAYHAFLEMKRIAAGFNDNEDGEHRQCGQ